MGETLTAAAIVTLVYVCLSRIVRRNGRPTRRVTLGDLCRPIIYFDYSGVIMDLYLNWQRIQRYTV